MIEAIVALHYTLDMPTDSLIFDVSHQAYPHKILTGRRHLMHRLRQFGGLSGFLSRKESLYDCFGAGKQETLRSEEPAMREAFKPVSWLHATSRGSSAEKSVRLRGCSRVEHLPVRKAAGCRQRGGERGEAGEAGSKGAWGRGEQRSMGKGGAKEHGGSGEQRSMGDRGGDGGLTGGMAYEALNACGHLQSKVLVVLNDNQQVSLPTGTNSAGISWRMVWGFVLQGAQRLPVRCLDTCAVC
ncbi:1-deoxy-d-xylulose 5-phosphate synthase [Cyclospora cayetanensis]|uniref:1-deoxy-d-xylulose 5-phosphate synthase n=1 Tax=Cyclospora cayetanensis TaxID=88456 RepID=A0A1D3CSH3_9EIME|nr:1-deoxy-d-xylulose 5-phosphate synthase [Cyclospora cayetanensis]